MMLDTYQKMGKKGSEQDLGLVSDSCLKLCELFFTCPEKSSVLKIPDVQKKIPRL